MVAAELHFIEPPKEGDRVSLAGLSPDERERANRFVFSEDAHRWSVYRAGLRNILGEALGIDPAHVPLTGGPQGKPFLAGIETDLEFNLSHADDLAVVVVSRSGPVGVDLEPWSRAEALLECCDSFCHPQELDRLPRDNGERARRLLEIWTSKEALLKAIGTGLSFLPQELRIEGDLGIADRPLEGLEKLRLLIPEHPVLGGYRVAVALTAGTTEIEYHC